MKTTKTDRLLSRAVRQLRNETPPKSGRDLLGLPKSADIARRFVTIGIGAAALVSIGMISTSYAASSRLIAKVKQGPIFLPKSVIAETVHSDGETTHSWSKDGMNRSESKRRTEIHIGNRVWT
jgi:hypothetical protein